MIYTEFNQYIRNRFFKTENIGSYVVLSVDDQIINDFCTINSITKIHFEAEFKRLFSESWHFATQPENFFGLTAIQVYVAHSMSEELINGYYISKSNYRDRLCNFLNINNDQLGRLFDYYQDKLWKQLENWAIKNHFYLNLPELSFGPYSKVRYPISQALLNQNDLSYLPNLYVISGLKPFEMISYYDFKGIICKSENPEILTNRFFRLKEKLLKEDNLDLLYLQVFVNYCNWEGEAIELEIRKHSGIDKIETERNSLILTSDKSELHIFKNGIKIPIQKFQIDCHDLFQKVSKFYRLHYSDLMFFIKDEDYDDWEISRFLIPGRINLIFCKCGDSCEYLVKKIDPNYILNQKRFYSIIEIKIEKDFIPDSLCERYFSRQTLPYIIRNGLKLDRKVWMAQAGPDIDFDQKVDVWINGKKLVFLDDNMTVSLRNYDVGKYVLKIRNYGPIHISIQEPEYSDSKGVCGWQIDKKGGKWNPDRELFQISGLANTFQEEYIAESEIRNWIDVNIGKINKEQNQNNTLITNAINRAKHGIRY